ncbi:hypothetical protein COLO4_25695 [Corchorus olitorius]|uniref:KIB1-4 beta-propeller domain-containing protein n=1 Tax=Corchorus olitorius TaxID=93759 RepID=A0A1R3I0E8_9ROSI|nr:hypothetical protein COLO4_25695 [Corchorus olitorius]
MEDNSREGETWIFHGAKACASSYGWVLFRNESLLFLYSSFTTELIKLPNVRSGFDVATFSLDATSPKCLVFCLKLDENKRKIYINLYSSGEGSWKTFEFGTNPPVSNDHIRPQLFQSRAAIESCVGIPVHAAYGGGIFYCVFLRGELGAFDVGGQEWTMLTSGEGVPDFDFSNAKLIVSTESDREILVIGRRNSWMGGDYYRNHQLLKFNFSELQWVQKNDLNKCALFIGCTCFFCPAGEARKLIGQVLSCRPMNIWELRSQEYCRHKPGFRCYNCNDGASGILREQYRNWLLREPDSMAWIDAINCYNYGDYNNTLSGNWVLTVPDSMAWIEFPLRGWVWRAKDLINAI